MKCYGCRTKTGGSWYCQACEKALKEGALFEKPKYNYPVDGIQTFGMGNPGHGRITRAYEREMYNRRKMPDGQVLPGHKRKNPVHFVMGS